MIESLIGLALVILGIGVGMYFQYWILCILIDILKGGGGGGGTPIKQESRIVRTMPARRQVVYAYNAIRSLA